MITTIDGDGVEHNNAVPIVSRGLVNYTAVAGSATINWTPVPGAVRYNVYRSHLLADGTRVTRDMEVGFIGTVRGTQFTDNNIIPDFKKAPPQNFNPFAPGQIRNIDVSNLDMIVAEDAKVEVVDDEGEGTGFFGYLVTELVNPKAEPMEGVTPQHRLTGVVILNGGCAFIKPRLVVSPLPIDLPDKAVDENPTFGETSFGESSRVTLYENEGLSFSYTVPEADGLNEPITYSANGLEGLGVGGAQRTLAFNVNTRVISGTPGDSDYTIVITATDTKNNTDMFTVNIEVEIALD